MGGGLYRSPGEVLRRELDFLKERLRGEREELAGLEARLAVERSEGLARLVCVVERDVERTVALVGEFRRAVRLVGGS